ncbi:MAG: serine hydrolase, partial [Bacteroidota bacterium]|nr:serine hydrolase [Bacteroidota bacterium]
KLDNLLAIPFINYSELDTAGFNKWERYYHKLFIKGVNCLFTEDLEASIFAKETGFQGIIITKMDKAENIDAFLESPAEMIYSDDFYEQFFSSLKKQCKWKKKYERMLNAKVKKILMAKIWLEQKDNELKNTNDISQILENHEIELLFRNIFKKSIITVKNKEKLLPIKNLYSKYTIYEISKNENSFSAFSNTVKKFISVNVNSINSDNKDLLKKIKTTSSSKLIFVFDTVPDKKIISYIKSIDTVKKVVVVYFGNINELSYFSGFNHLVFSDNNNPVSQFYTAQLLFGGIKSSGQIPDYLAKELKIEQAQKFSKIRLSYDIPEMVGLKTSVLEKIDSIANTGIRNGAFPGCQVFVAKKGVIIWEKAYGFHTYSKQITTKTTDLFDIASVTKVAATTLAAMKMYEQGKLPLNVPIKKYFRNTKIDYDRINPDTTLYIDTLNIREIKNWKNKIKGTDTIWLNDSIIVSYDTVIYKLTPKNNIFKVTPRQFLMHKSGVQPAMPILRHLLIINKKFIRIKDLYKKYDKDTIIKRIRNLRKKIYTNIYIKDSANIKVAQGMYMKKAFMDTLWKDTKQLHVTKKKNYIYSDVNMILLQMTIDSINGYSISKFMQRNFYDRLYLKNIFYNPLQKTSRNRIAPTENDKYWRRQVVWGTVHDPSAAIIGQIAGNAGLFSNAFSLGVLGQMLLNGGKYGGSSFLSKKIVTMFTQTQADSHRGLGFDKWSRRQIIAKDASQNTYGHTGFTGTCIWVDPDNEIVFVFLSNRVHPNARNWRINKYRIRQKIHQSVYDARK